MYLALADGAARFMQGFTGPALLRIPLPPPRLRLQDFHPLWCCFPGSFDLAWLRILWSYNPTIPVNRNHGLGCFPFARHYLGNHYCFLFLRVLRCFSSPGSPPFAWISQQLSCRDGFPHSDTRGSTLLCSSPQLFAAWHVLHRHCIPRHPPYTLFYFYLHGLHKDFSQATHTSYELDFTSI
jgi:hypothetical protein